MNLNEAIEFVLKRENRGMSAQEIANIINEQKLYVRNDGEKVPAAQIVLRVNKYPERFEIKENNLIYRKDSLYKDILDIATKTQSELRNAFEQNRRIEITNEVITSFILFYKWAFDKESILNRLFISTLEEDFNYDGLLEFANKLNSEDTLFHNKLNEFINAIGHNKKTQTASIINRSLLLLKEISLTKVNNNELGEIYSKVLDQTFLSSAKNRQFSTPKELACLIGVIMRKHIKHDVVLYSPGAGMNEIATFLSRNISNDFVFYGEEINQNVYVIGLINLYCNDITIGDFKNENILEHNLEHNKNQFADIVISQPPFSTNLNNETKDIVLIFIQRALEALKPGGTAAIFVPESFLFNLSRDYKKLRKYLIDNLLLESIISLPVGILKPTAAVKINLLILSKKQNNEVLFIDANTNGFYVKEKYGIKLGVDKIAKIYHRRFDENIVCEPESEYGKKAFDRISIEKIQENDYNLNLRQHLILLNEEPNLVSLHDILKPYHKGRTQLSEDYPYVQIKDLNNDFKTIYLNEAVLQKNDGEQKGKLVDSTALLVSSIAPKMKPTIFQRTNSPIVISNSLHAFKVKDKKENEVNLEFLLFELSSEKVLSQFDALATGITSLNRISSQDFLRIKIHLPEINEQKKIVRKQKEALYADKLNEANKFAEAMGVTRIQEQELLGFIKHEVGNITGGILNDVINLNNFLKRKELNLDERISGHKNARTLNQVFASAQSNLTDIDNLMSNIQSIIDIGSQKSEREELLFKQYVDSEVQKHLGIINENNVNVFIGIEDIFSNTKDVNIKLIKEQFSIVIRNFIINSIRHGFIENQPDKVIVFHLAFDDDFNYIALINNGVPFPENFTLNDFLKFGGRVDNSKGSGIGGYLIDKVVENHNGDIDLLEPGTALFSDLPKNEPRFINNEFIKAGVHFLIKIPIE
jgi:type I restriction enzyme M protein